jgi:hypothetical protein
MNAADTTSENPFPAGMGFPLAAAMTVEDAAALARMAARSNASVFVRLDVAAWRATAPVRATAEARFRDGIELQPSACTRDASRGSAGEPRERELVAPPTRQIGSRRHV